MDELILTAFFLQAANTLPVVPPAIVPFLLDLLRFLLGSAIVAVVGTSVKLWRDVALLQKQRSADLIEYDTALAMAQTVKHETNNLKTEFDSKLKDVMHHFALQQKEDREMMKDMFHEVNITLTKLNSTIEAIQDKNK